MEPEALNHLQVGERRDIEDVLPVTFRPPLYEQRRGWVLEILRKEQVRSLIDIGCGEGFLLSCLCNPAMYLPIPTDISSPELDVINSHKPELSELHVTNMMGLDICVEDLQEAAKRTSPQSSSQTASTYATAQSRWEHLNVSLFLGNLTMYNERFSNAECIVCTEVIEHLPPDELPEFAPMMFGSYRPRLLLLTTPSYTFNARFYPPGAILSSPKYLSTHFQDPTGRTNRFFRHHDHKLEWTTEEFNMWCQTVANAYGYSVEIAGIGRPLEADPWERDTDLGCATQVALFRRLDNHLDMDEAEEMEVLRDLDMDATDDTRSSHQIIAQHYYPAHPLAGQFATPQVISAGVAALLKEYGRMADYSWTVYQIWVENPISEICGGRLDKLLEALFHSHELVVSANENGGTNGWGGWLNWVVRLRNPVVPDKQLDELEGILNDLDIKYQPPEQLEFPSIWGVTEEGWANNDSSSPRWSDPWSSFSQDDSLNDEPVNE